MGTTATFPTTEPVAIRVFGGAVWSLAFSPGDGTLAIAGDDGRVDVWSLADGSCRRLGVEHESVVASVAFSGDGRWLASGGLDRTARVWDVARECERCVLSVGDAVYAVALSGEGDVLATAGRGGGVTVWDLCSGEPRAEFRVPRRPAHAVVFAPDGESVVAGDGAGSVHVWSLVKGNHEVLGGHEGAVTSLVFLPKAADGLGLRLASADARGNLRIWDLMSNELDRDWQAHEGAVWSVAVSPDGGQLASGGNDGVCRLWDVTGRLLWEDVGTAAVACVAFAPDGGWLAVGRKDGTVQLWNGSELLRVPVV